jgi:hypothetical protein
MEFHLPFFALRKVKPNESLPRFPAKRLREDWEDITLQPQDSIETDGKGTYRIHRAQISCVVHGFDEWQWNAYAFEDTKHENDLENEAEEVINYQLDGNNVTFDVDDEDPISLHLDWRIQPIWKPRQYFLKAFEMQIRKIRREWNSLVHKLDVDRTEYVSLSALDFCTASGLQELV